MALTYDPIFAADPSNAANVAANASIILFDPNDAGKAPIAITDVTGAALPNPITVNKNGFGPAFQHATLDRVGWFGAGFTGYFTSYEGMKAVAVEAAADAQAAAGTAGTEAAAVATAAIGTATDASTAAAASAATAASNASASATAAANSAALVGAPADAAITAAINNGASATRGALNATYATAAGTRKAVARSGTIVPMAGLPAVMSAPPTRSLNPAAGDFLTFNLGESRSKVTPKGGLFSTYTANGYDSWRNTSNPVTSSAYPAANYIEFLADNSFDILFRDNSGSALSCIWAWVDELDGLGWQRVTAVTESTGAAALAGAAQVFRYAFGTSKLRRVRLFFKNCDFAGVRHSPTTIMQPAPHAEVKVAIQGDSWTDNASSVLAQHSAFYTAALLLGMEPLLAGQAGTGYVTPTSNANLGNFLDTRRTDPIIAAAPDLIIIEGSINDDLNYGPTPGNPGAPAGTAPPATIQANAAALYARYATALPNTKLIVFGPQSVGLPASGTGDNGVNRLANRDAVKAAALAAPNVLGFVDPIAERWVAGSGNTTAPTGYGPSDKLMNSTYHLGQVGHDVIASRVAQSVADLLNGTPRPVITLAAPTLPDIIFVSDAFTRADNATVLGTTMTGAKTWTVLDSGAGATAGVISNQAYVTGGGNAFYVVDAGLADVKVKMTMKSKPSGGIGGPVAVRAVDGSNGIFVSCRSAAGVDGKYSLMKRLAGTNTALYDGAEVPTANDVVEVTALGTTITFKVNGATLWTGTVTDFSTSTKHGFFGNYTAGGVGARYDDFEVRAA